MVIEFIEFFTVLPVPYYDFAVFASWSQVPIAFTDIQVCDNIFMTVEWGLEIEWVTIPDFYNPIIGTANNEGISLVKFNIINGCMVAFLDHCVTEDCFHSLKVLNHTLLPHSFRGVKFISKSEVSLPKDEIRWARECKVGPKSITNLRQYYFDKWFKC